MADDKPRAQPEPERLPESYWVENPHLLRKAAGGRVSQHAIAGALGSHQRKTHSPEEAEALVKEFLSREVQAEPAQED